MEWLLMSWIGGGLLCAILAPSRGRSGVDWLVLGILFSPLALVVLLVLPGRKTEPRSKRASSTPAEPTLDDSVQDTLARRAGRQKDCPGCHHQVASYARRCRHCNHRFTAETAARQA